MAGKLKRGGGSFGKKIERTAEDSAEKAVLWIVGTIVFGAVVALWNAAKNGGRLS